MTTTPESTKGVPRIESNPAPTLRADHNDLADWVRDHTGESVPTTADLPSSGTFLGRTIRVVAENVTYVYMGGSIGWRADLIGRLAQPRSNTPVANASPVILTGSASGTTNAGGLLQHNFRTPMPNGTSIVLFMRTDGNSSDNPYVQGNPSRTGFQSFWPGKGSVNVAVDYLAIGY